MALLSLISTTSMEHSVSLHWQRRLGETPAPVCNIDVFKFRRRSVGVLDVANDAAGQQNNRTTYFYRERKDGMYDVRRMPREAEVVLLLQRATLHGHHGPDVPREVASATAFDQCTAAHVAIVSDDVPPLLLPSRPTNDDIMMQELRLLALLQEPLITRIVDLGDDSINPVLLHWPASSGDDRDGRWLRIDSTFCCAPAPGARARDAVRVVNMASTLTVVQKGAASSSNLTVWDTGETMRKEAGTAYTVAINASTQVTCRLPPPPQ